MSTPFVVHHVDYRSKAMERRAELDDLRKQSLTKAKAARLQDADAPIDMYHSFLEKQRRMFVDQRKSHAAAIEFLHSYRADDEIVLRETIHRQSIGSSSNHRNSLSPSQTPDAKAAVYPSYPTVLSYGPTRTVDEENNNNDPLSSKSTIIANTDRSKTTGPSVYFIQDSPVEFETVLQTMLNRAREAANVPLPSSSADEDDNDDDEDKLVPLFIVEEGTTKPLSSIQRKDGSIGVVEEGASSSEVQIIPSYDDDVTTAPSTDMNHHSIPFESYLKLGESQIMEQVGTSFPPPYYDGGLQIMTGTTDSEQDDYIDNNGDDDDEGGGQVVCDDYGIRSNCCDYDSNSNDKFIPGVSFMNLGASMLAEALSMTPKNSDIVDSDDQGDCDRHNDGDDDTAPLTEPLTEPRASQMEDSGVVIHTDQGHYESTRVTTTPTKTVHHHQDVMASETATTSVPYNMETPAIADGRSIEILIVPSSSGLSQTDDVQPYHESKGTETAIDRIGEDRFIVAMGPVSEGGTNTTNFRNIDNWNAAVDDQEFEKYQQNDVVDVPENYPQKSLEEGGDDTLEDTLNNAMDATSVTSESQCDRKIMLNSHAAFDCSTETETRAIESESFNKESTVEAIREDEIAPTLEANDTSDCLSTNDETTTSARPLDHSSAPEDVQVAADSTPTTEQQTGTDRRTPTSARRRQQPKSSRKKGQGYYPSSSLFVSRQFFSR